MPSLVITVQFLHYIYLILKNTKTYLYSGSRDCLVSQWNIELQKHYQRFRGHTQSIRGIRLLDKRLITASANELKTWDITSSEWISTQNIQNSIVSLDLCNQNLIDCRNDRSLTLWNLSQSIPKIIRTFEGHSSPVFSVAIQGIRIISGSQDKIIKIWNLENGKCMITLKGHGSSVVSLQCDDKKLMSGEIYGDIKIWNFVQDFNQGTTK